MDLTAHRTTESTVQRTEQRAWALLVACVHQDPHRVDAVDLDSFEDAHWNRWLELVAVQRVGALSYQRLRERGRDQRVPARVRAELKAAAQRSAFRGLRIQAQLLTVTRALRASGIQVATLKGAYLASEVYHNAALREMRDLDVLVRRRDLSRAVERLASLGYRPRRPFSIEADVAVYRHVTGFCKSGGDPLELHWNITTPGSRDAIDPEPLWARMVPMQQTDGILGLSPEDVILHLCRHTAYDDLFDLGLRPLCDVANTIRCFQESLDWTRLRARAHQWRWTREVWLTLRLAAMVVGADVPVDVLEDLAPADEDGAIVGVAEGLLHETLPSRNRVAPEIALLVGDSGLRSRAVRCVKRIFLPLNELRAEYLPSVRSRLAAIAYPLRVIDLVRRHRTTVFQALFKQNCELRPIAERRDQLCRWLVAR